MQSRAFKYIDTKKLRSLQNTPRFQSKDPGLKISSKFVEQPWLCFPAAYSESYIIDAIYNMLHPSPIIDNETISIYFLSKWIL